MKKLALPINVTTEAEALAAFIDQTWTAIPDIKSLFNEIRDAALHESRAWFDNYAVGFLAHDMMSARRGLLVTQLATEAEKEAGPFYDGVCHVLDQVWSHSDVVAKLGREIDGSWDYSDRVDAVYAKLAKKYPGLSSAKPLGWAALAKDYSDFDGQEEYDGRAANELFQGMDVSSAGSCNFVNNTALPYVMYDEKCQGRKAPRVLVAAVFSHFLGIREFMNTQEMCDALKALPLRTDPEVLFDIEMPTSSNTLMQVLLQMARAPYTAEDYQKSLDARAAYDAMSDEEKAARKVEADIETEAMIDRIRAQGDNPSARSVALKAKCAELLKQSSF